MLCTGIEGNHLVVLPLRTPLRPVRAALQLQGAAICSWLLGKPPCSAQAFRSQNASPCSLQGQQRHTGSWLYESHSKYSIDRAGFYTYASPHARLFRLSRGSRIAWHRRKSINTLDNEIETPHRTAGAASRAHPCNPDSDQKRRPGVQTISRHLKQV